MSENLDLSVQNIDARHQSTKEYGYKNLTITTADQDNLMHV